MSGDVRFPVRGTTVRCRPGAGGRCAARGVARKSVVKTLVEFILSIPRVFLSGGCKVCFAGNGGALAKKRNAADAAPEQPNVKIDSARDLGPVSSAMRRLAYLIFVCAITAASPPSGATAGALRLFAAGASDSGAAARQAAAMTGGRVLNVQPQSAGGRQVYEVKVLLHDGRVKVVRIEGTRGGQERR